MRISEVTMMRRPSPPRTPPSTLSSLLKPTLEQQRALARIADYPQRVERLKCLWADLYAPRPCSYSFDRDRSSCYERSWRPGSEESGQSLSSTAKPYTSSYHSSSRSRSSSRLARAGAAAVGAKLTAKSSCRTAMSSSRGGRCLGDRSRLRRPDQDSLVANAGYLGGPLTARQIQELMTRDLTPEDYELLLLLDEGVKKARTLSTSAAANLPRAEGTAWYGDECRICLCALEEGEDVVSLPGCGHLFHGPCAERWLSASKASCPLCGNEIGDCS